MSLLFIFFWSTVVKKSYEKRGPQHIELEYLSFQAKQKFTGQEVQLTAENIQILGVVFSATASHRKLHNRFWIIADEHSSRIRRTCSCCVCFLERQEADIAMISSNFGQDSGSMINTLVAFHLLSTFKYAERHVGDACWGPISMVRNIERVCGIFGGTIF